LISANQQLGIYLNHSATNLIQGNFVGTGSSGTESLGNSLDGMIISDSPDNLIGGTAPGTRNLIANNGYGSTDGGSGIYLFGPASMRNQILGNVIGTDISGTIMLSNSRDGVTIFAGSANVVGGPALGAGNLLSGNADTGVYILGDTASANKVQGNFIGTRPDGITRLDHRLHGVQIDTGAFNNIIGGLG